MNYDIIILGSGPCGYVAVIRASQLGKKVAVIETNYAEFALTGAVFHQIATEKCSGF